MPRYFQGGCRLEYARVLGPIEIFPSGISLQGTRILSISALGNCRQVSIFSACSLGNLALASFSGAEIPRTLLGKSSGILLTGSRTPLVPLGYSLSAKSLPGIPGAKSRSRLRVFSALVLSGVRRKSFGLSAHLNSYFRKCTSPIHGISFSGIEFSLILRFEFSAC